jgi:hypothetical protein
MLAHNVALWIDVQKEDVLGAWASPTAPKINQMKASNTWLVQKYNKLLNQELGKLKVKQKLQALAKTQDSTEPMGSRQNGLLQPPSTYPYQSQEED